MKKRLAFQFLTILIFILVSCTSNTPIATPISHEDAVATAVATMLNGIPTNTPLPEPTATLTPEPQTLLPHSLYYIAQDANGKGQIYRLNRDGTTNTQITFESDGVVNFEIFPKDGIIAYISQKSLITVDANGENRRNLIQDPNIGSSLACSSDGKTIAYTANGIYVYSLETGKTVMVIANDYGTPAVKGFSPDGSKLIVSTNYNIAIYNFVSGNLSVLDSKTSNIGNLNQVSWLPDSKHIFIYADIGAGGVQGIMSPGLWQFNAENGSGGALLSADGNHCVQAPKQETDGNLVYLYTEGNGCASPPLSLVRASSDGVSNRAVIRPEIFNATNTVWTPDGNALLILQDNGINFAPVNMILVSLNPSLPVVTVMADASTLSPYSLRWGP